MKWKTPMIQYTQVKSSQKCWEQYVIRNSSITPTSKFSIHVLTLTNSKAYVIYIRHASFQLYHCRFPKQYLHELYHDGVPTSEGVTLNRTKPYDFCDVQERGEWFDVVVALIQYLLSGESKVGFLNNQHPRNLIHKVSPPAVRFS